MPLTSTGSRIGSYRIIEELGAGAHGTVFLAESALGSRVALKSLKSESAPAAELKREFRLASDLSHPNLVLPYSLESDGERVFITMELVLGVPWLDWVATTEIATRDEQLTQATAQLCDGLLALHRRGLIHGDIKPSNVLVEPSGRVAILDFGLARRVQGGNVRTSDYLAGTPAYLAPEVLSGSGASPASDAYAVGVLIHQALTGRLPYHESVQESMIRRCASDAPPVIPAEGVLAVLCTRLLEPEPRLRPSLAEVAATLGAQGALGLVPAPSFFRGREIELGQLTRAWAASKELPRTTVVHVRGASGMGKSALLRCFGERAAKQAWVLEARAYEQDWIPYKALDAAIDQLAHQLEELAPEARAALAPPDASALGDLFPGLAAALGWSGREASGMVDAPAMRRRGSRALRTLLQRVSEQFGLVILLDDVHWGDRDSARLLADVLAGGGFSNLLVLGFRPELADCPFLRELEEASMQATTLLSVEALNPDEALNMARGLSANEQRAAAAAAEAAGCPFLIELLLASTPPAASARRTIDGLLVDRVLTLPAPMRELLELVCLAGRPIRLDHVPPIELAASEVRVQARKLLGARLLRFSAGASDDTSLDAHNSLEPYHDRIRETVTTSMATEARREKHRALGEAFAANDDAEGAAVHLAAAGDHARVHVFARRAAEMASSALAFERAAELLALGISSCQDASTSHQLELERARALANAGHGSEAGPLFLACAARVGGLECIDLKRQAMEQFLVAGRFARGWPVTAALLRDLRVFLPRTAWLRTALMWVEAILLLLRGPRLASRRTLADREQLLLGTFLSLGKGYGHFDAAIGSLFFLRAARLALAWGVPDVAAQGTAYVGALFGFSGTASGFRRANVWIAKAEEIAGENSDGYGLAFGALARGMTLCCSGRWHEAITRFDAAATSFGEHFAKGDWEATVARTTALFALMQLGNFSELEARARSCMQDALRRGDLALEVEAALNLALCAAASDRLDEARELVERTMKLWDAPSYTFQHWIALRVRTSINLLQARYDVAVSELDTETRFAEQAGLTEMQVVCIEAAETRGRAYLGAALGADPRKRAALLKRVRKLVDDLHRIEGRPHALAPSYVLEAGIVWSEGKHEQACEKLEQAAASYREARMEAHAAAAELNLARGRGEQDLMEKSARWLRDNGVACPERWARAQFPVEER